MSEYNYQINMKEENSLLFKKSIRKLFESTFILKDKDEKLYYYVSKESNRRDISEYLKMIGFDILVNDKCNVAMLVASEQGEDTVGLKRANIITFSTLQYHLLLVLWEVYLENLGYDEKNYVSKGDLIDKIKSYGIYPSVSDLKAAFKLFKKYSLINYEEYDDSEDAKIQLYHSLQFGWDIPQFKAVVDEHLKPDNLDDEIDSIEEDKADYEEEEND